MDDDDFEKHKIREFHLNNITHRIITMTKMYMRTANNSMILVKKDESELVFYTSPNSKSVEGKN